MSSIAARLPLLTLALLASPRPSTAQHASLPACEWCGALEAPPGIGPHARIAPPSEPGPRLEVTGTVYAADGTTPAPGVVLYAYHTSASGVYPKRGDEAGNGRRHGYLRGWLRTDARGRYRLSTIRPAPYPGRTDPAHIHITVLAAGGTEYWIDAIEFDDDSRLTPAERARRRNTGGRGIVRAVTDAQGVQHARRDIILEPGS